MYKLWGGNVSVIDELKGLEDRVAQRMLELRPLVEEYRELEQVAERLGVSPAAGTDTPARTRRRSQRRAQANRGAARPASRTASDARAASKTARPAGGGRADGRREQLLEMVKARPGITVREVGTELGVDPTSLYRIVHRLERDGALRKRGRELLPR
jgi:Homeodomain-like domain